MKLLFATNNKHKIEEIQSAIGNLVEVTGLKDAGINIDIPEPYDTLEKNAAEKSSVIYALTAISCFSEDTGLEIAALNGEPGVRSARYAGEGRSSEDNIDLVLRKMYGINNRKAQFRTVISLIWNGKEYLFEGVCPGNILNERRGNKGFGYDAIFVPDGSSSSFGEMSIDEKNSFSHRKKAADQLVSFLQLQQ
ncbi:MAG: RdgB/HAM1 family non-canonical purine NTP pyrophosphatase [Chitinophagaceae bacterium]|nr:RdgB/HAM1 family non-canonical purine NTP pyrophosphatase [Chitinophagaceae bacterium]